MKNNCRYRSKASLIARNVVWNLLPPKWSHRINTLKNIRWKPLDAEMDLLRRFLEFARAESERTVVLDVGANLGLYTELFVSTGVEVCAFEPQPNLVKYLQKIYGSRIDLYEIALSNSTDLVEMLIPSLSSRWLRFGDVDALATVCGEEQIMDPGIRSSKKIMVETRPLDMMTMPEGEVALIKIDVEGNEIGVLDGASRFLNLRKPLLFVEVAARNQEKFLELMKAHEYEVLRFNKSGNQMELVVDGPSPSDENLFGVPKTSQLRRVFSRSCDELQIGLKSL